jgi:Cyanate lyase
MEMDIKTAVGMALDKKSQKNITFDDLSEKTGRDPMFIAAALNGMQRLNNTDLDTIANVLELDADTKAAFAQLPIRLESPMTADPFKYRLMEMVGVYSDALRQRMQELFADETGRGGDAIPSAIDFTIDLQRGIGKAGDKRVIITLDAKYLEYREF